MRCQMASIAPPMRILISAIGLLVALSSCGGMPAPAPGSDAPNAPAVPTTGPYHAAALIDVDGEAAQLRAALMREVPEVIVDHSEGERVWIARAKAAADGERADDRPGSVADGRRPQPGYPAAAYCVGATG